jgi:hypothetical protein
LKPSNPPCLLYAGDNAEIIAIGGELGIMHPT